MITGDFTYGQESDSFEVQGRAGSWWRVVRKVLAPIREAGIPVLPVAGNHDTDLLVYQKAYARAWRDLESWASPLPIHGAPQPAFRVAFGAVPFTYATDVDGVHLTFAHVVGERIDPAVQQFIARDLAAASDASLRLLAAHVPVVAIGTEPRREFEPDFARLLAAGHVDVYLAGHEHLCWDEVVQLPGGGELRQIVAGSVSAQWRFGPNTSARRRAGCKREGWGRMRCRMPEGSVPFELVRDGERWLQADTHTFTLVTVDGTAVTTRVLVVDRGGGVTPFGSGVGDPAPPGTPPPEGALP
jgi:hypothetical protein